MALRKKGQIVSNIWEGGGAEALSPTPYPHLQRGCISIKKTFMYNAFHLNLKLENEPKMSFQKLDYWPGIWNRFWKIHETDFSAVQ